MDRQFMKDYFEATYSEDVGIPIESLKTLNSKKNELIAELHLNDDQVKSMEEVMALYMAAVRPTALEAYLQGAEDRERMLKC